MTIGAKYKAKPEYKKKGRGYVGKDGITGLLVQLTQGNYAMNILIGSFVIL
jgi:hypothetical protein